MPHDRLAATADRLRAARVRGERIALAEGELPADFAQGFAIQERVVAGLGSPIIGWKVLQVPEGPVIFAPILQSGRIAAGGTWTVAGVEPAGIELEVAFRMGSNVAPGASGAAVLEAVAAAHVVFELCQSRIANPEAAPRHVMLADCIANAGVVIGPEIAGFRTLDLAARSGRLLVDGKVHAEGRSGDPLATLQLLPPALAAREKGLLAGQIVITGSLIGMNWLRGRHDLVGRIDGCGEVALTLIAE
jgi:2-keto-4-pentenoate hydratase